MEKVRRLTDIVGNETVRSLWDGLVAACGEREFLLFRDRTGSTSSYTYRAFNEEIDRAANVFLSMGVAAGARRGPALAGSEAKQTRPTAREV